LHGLNARVEKRNEVLSQCVVARAYASGASALDTGSAKRGGRVLPAAGLAHFFARTVRWKRQGLAEMREMEWNGS